MSAVQQVVMIGDVEQFANVMNIAACDDCVTVTIHNMIEGDRVYTRTMSTFATRENPAWAASQIAQQIEEVAALVSTGALVHWLLDCGFVLNA